MMMILTMTMSVGELFAGRLGRAPQVPPGQTAHLPKVPPSSSLSLSASSSSSSSSSSFQSSAEHASQRLETCATSTVIVPAARMKIYPCAVSRALQTTKMTMMMVMKMTVMVIMMKIFLADELEKMRPAYHCDFRKTFNPELVNFYHPS